MKRVKETYHKGQPSFVDREGVSGCKEFDGEDLEHEARTQYFKNKQKEWFEQQMSEKERMRQQEKFEEELYAQQIQEVTRMRQMLEDDFKRKKQAIQSSITNENLIMAQQKKNREAMEKFQKLQEEKQEIAMSTQKGQARPFQGF